MTVFWNGYIFMMLLFLVKSKQQNYLMSQGSFLLSQKLLTQDVVALAF